MIDYWNNRWTRDPGTSQGSGLYGQAIISAIRQYAPSAKTIYEIGCGSGLLTELLLDAFPTSDITVTDASDAALALCKDRLKERLPRMERVDIINDVPVGKADVVVAKWVLQHVPPGDMQKALRFLSSITRGHFIHMDFAGDLYTIPPAPAQYQWSHDYPACMTGLPLTLEERGSVNPDELRHHLFIWRKTDE